MNIEFSLVEARVIGSLLEKQVTTPDQYPLSINALTAACNQKTNREPVMELGEAEVQQAIDALMKKYMVSDRSAGYGGRVTKYQQRFCNTEFGPLKFSKQEVGVLCVLLLRGPQTPGELRARTNRMCEFRDTDEVEQVLKALMEREDGPFLTRLARAPGSREARYGHLFSGEPVAPVQEAAAEEPAAGSSLGARVAALEDTVAALQVEIAALRSERGS